MSGQTLASPNDPYYLSSRGVNNVQFRKLSSPPLAYLDRGILYELDDGKLYFNGSALTPIAIGNVTGPAVSTDKAIATYDGTDGSTIQNNNVIIDADLIKDAVGLEMQPVVDNPGNYNALWLDEDLLSRRDIAQLMHGLRSLENCDPRAFWVNPEGRLPTDGASGDILDPYSGLVVCLQQPEFADKAGTLVNVAGQLAEAIDLPPNCIISGAGNCNGSFDSLLGNITVTGAEWLTPSPFFYNQSFITNCVLVGTLDWNQVGQDTPLISIVESVLIGDVTIIGPNSAAKCFIRNCNISSNINITDANVRFVDCGATPTGSSVLNINCTSETDSMNVELINVSSDMSIVVNHSSSSQPLYLRIVGCFEGNIDFQTIGYAGAITFTYDDCNNITDSVGLLVDYVKFADTVGYDNTTSGLAAINVQEAIDEISNVTTDAVVGPASATDNAICRFDGITGKLIQNSTVTIDDTGIIRVPNSLTNVIEIFDGVVYPVLKISNALANTYCGVRAGNVGSSGTSNTGFGTSALRQLSSGSSNTTIGSAAGMLLTSGSNNTLAGTDCMASGTTAANNVIFGDSSGAAITSEANNIILGRNSNIVAGHSNTIVIGSGITSPASASILIGNTAVHTNAYIAGIYANNSKTGITGAVRCDQNSKLHYSPSNVFGELFFEDYGSPTTGVLTLATPAELQPTCSLLTNDSNYINNPTAYRLRWLIANSMYCMARVQLSFVNTNPALAEYTFYIAKNGMLVSGTTIIASNASTSVWYNVDISHMISMSANDYISVFCINNTNSDDIDIGRFSMSLQSSYQ